MPRFSEEVLQSLESLITTEEVLATLKSSPTGKVPGPEALFDSYYKSLTQIFIPHFVDAFSSLTVDRGLGVDSLHWK